MPISGAQREQMLRVVEERYEEAASRGELDQLAAELGISKLQLYNLAAAIPTERLYRRMHARVLRAQAEQQR